MITNIGYTIEIFIFIFCLLNVIKNVYNFIKIMKQHEGKLETSLSSQIMLGLSISYILTAIIIGF